MKKILLLSISCLAMAFCQAQNDVQFTNYNFSKLSYNPAYAGSNGAPSMAAIYRNQWVTLDGAPQTLHANFHMPFYENKCGFGVALTSDQVGMVKTNALDVSYAYRFKTGDTGKMSLGVTGRLEHGKIDWTRAAPLDLGDDQIPTISAGQFQPNFGFGAYYEAANLYAGFSIPQLINTTLYQQEDVNGQGGDYRTSYFMMGYLMKLNKDIKFQPGVLFSFNAATPFEVAATANFIFLNTFWIGGNYRVGDSFDAMIQYQISKEMRAGISFDFTTSDLNKFTNGSIELMVAYNFDGSPKAKKAENINNLRYF